MHWQKNGAWIWVKTQFKLCMSPISQYRVRFFLWFWIIMNICQMNWFCIKHFHSSIAMRLKFVLFFFKCNKYYMDTYRGKKSVYFYHPFTCNKYMKLKVLQKLKWWCYLIIGKDAITFPKIGVSNVKEFSLFHPSFIFEKPTLYNLVCIRELAFLSVKYWNWWVSSKRAAAHLPINRQHFRT